MSNERVGTSACSVLITHLFITHYSGHADHTSFKKNKNSAVIRRINVICVLLLNGEQLVKKRKAVSSQSKGDSLGDERPFVGKVKAML